MPLLTFPLALIGLVGLPTLAAIYYLRNRFRKHQVSSLMLWMDHRAPREGGARIQKISTPLLFFLEIAAITLLALAATGPRMLVNSSDSPLMIVLDDSLSMQAERDGESTRGRAIDRVLDLLGSEGRFDASFITAGRRPNTLGQATNKREAEAVLGNWACESDRDCLNEAITFAAELGGPRARLLVISDRGPGEQLEEGSVRWFAMGKPTGNVAITNALRAESGDAEKYVIELANLSKAPAVTELTVTETGKDQPRVRRALELEPNESRRFTFNLEEGVEALDVRISDDALLADNHAVLLPPDRSKLSVQLRIGDESLRRSVLQALRATDRIELATRDGHLLITDDANTAPAGSKTWPVYLLKADKPSAYVGPFVVDLAHPMARGLSLVGVVWTAGEIEMRGTPIVAAGNKPLVTDTERITGRHDLRIAINTDASTLSQSINWPILFSNLVRWRADEAPGVREPNVRLGTETSVTFEDDIETVTLTRPDGDKQDLRVIDNQVTLPADRAGVWRLTAGDDAYRFAVNALGRDEFDLQNNTTGETGNWMADQNVRRQYHAIDWLFGLVAMGVLTAHVLLISQSSRGGEGGVA